MHPEVILLRMLLFVQQLRLGLYFQRQPPDADEAGRRRPVELVRLVVSGERKVIQALCRLPSDGSRRAFVQLHSDCPADVPLRALDVRLQAVSYTHLTLPTIYSV